MQLAWAMGFVLIALFAGLWIGCASSEETTTNKELVWPAPPEKPRIKYLTFYADRKSVEGSGPALLERLAGEESADRMSKPYGVVVDRTGKVYVTDTGDRRVFVFDPANKKLSFIGQSPTGTVGLPLGIAVDTSVLAYIADGKLKVVLVYNQSGDLVRTIGHTGELENPSGVVVNETLGRVYVVDSQAHEVKVYTKDGTFLFKFGKRGTGDGEFNYPTNIAIGKDGKLYIVDTINARVEVFDADGTFLWKFGSLGDALGQFSRPKGIALDSQGNIYVVDAAFNNFQIFNPKGELLMFVGSLGRDAGRFWLPAGIGIDNEDRIYVVDQMNTRVQVFQLIKHAE